MTSVESQKSKVEAKAEAMANVAKDAAKDTGKAAGTLVDAVVDLGLSWAELGVPRASKPWKPVPNRSRRPPSPSKTSRKS